MNKVIGVREFQQTLDSVFDEVSRKQVPYVLTRGSRPEAALVPYEEFLRFQEFQESTVLARFDRAVGRLAEGNARFSEDEVAADVAAARNELPG